MALNTNALTTIARVAEFLGITAPTSGSATEIALFAQINGVSNFIERYTGVTFKQTTYTQELYSTERSQSLNLQHYPIVSGESFLLERRNSQLNESNWETIDGEFYTVDEKAGIIFGMGGILFFRTRNGYRVTYVAGYNFDNSTTFLSETDGADIELAAWLMIQDMNSTKASDGTLKSEKIGDYTVTYAKMANTIFNNPQALAILDSYKALRGEGVLTPLQSV